MIVSHEDIVNNATTRLVERQIFFSYPNYQFVYEEFCYCVQRDYKYGDYFLEVPLDENSL